MNAGDNPAQVLVTFTTVEGPPGSWEVRGIIGYGLAATFYLPAVPAMPDESVFSATVRSLTGEPLVVLGNSANALKRVGMVVSDTAPSSAISVPWFTTESEGWRSGVLVENRGAQPAPIALGAWSDAGLRLLQLQDVIPAGGSKTFYGPTLAGVPKGFTGALTITGSPDAQLTAVVNDVR